MNNRRFGIELQSSGADVLIQGNSIIENQGDGVVVLVGSTPVIQKNEIVDNETGVVLNSCDARLHQNMIFRSKKNGVVVMTHCDLLNNSAIKMNQITGNKLNGILVEGKNALVLIQSNYHISENGECGIKVCAWAEAKIINNFIYYNSYQGILLQERAVARVQLNSIFKNMKANLVLGGELSGETMVFQNSIHSSPSEGVFMIQCSNAMLYKNDIFGNYDGVVVYESCPEIRNNSIRNNSTNGALILKGSAPIVEGNLIEENEVIGLVVKDISAPRLLRNKIENNEVNVASENIPFNNTLNKDEFKGRNIFLNRDVCAIF
jgi:parallel beta-helix repeat protein